MRNVVLAMVAVTSLHLLVLMSERGQLDAPDGRNESAIKDRANAIARRLSPGGRHCLRREGFPHDPSNPNNANCPTNQSTLSNASDPQELQASNGIGGGGSGMPMDGLREMFEFASAKGACTDASTCDRPDLGPISDGARIMTKTNDVYPEQIAGPYAVVNAYEDEGVANGGAANSGGIAAFDGWGDAASFEACQTEGTNSH